MPYLFSVLHLLLPVIYLIVVGFISKCFLSSILVLSISLLVFCSGCKIFQIFYSAAYLWSIRDCSCALKLGWIQLCCFDLLFLTSSVIPIHMESACLWLFHSLSNGDIFVPFIFYTWWSLVFLFFNTHVWISYLPYFSTRFDYKWTGTLLYPYTFSSPLLLNHFDLDLSELCLLVHSLYSCGITESVCLFSLYLSSSQKLM